MRFSVVFVSTLLSFLTFVTKAADEPHNSALKKVRTSIHEQSLEVNYNGSTSSPFSEIKTSKRYRKLQSPTTKPAGTDDSPSSPSSPTPPTATNPDSPISSPSDSSPTPPTAPSDSTETEPSSPSSPSSPNPPPTATNPASPISSPSDSSPTPPTATNPASPISSPSDSTETEPSSPSSPNPPTATNPASNPASPISSPSDSPPTPPTATSPSSPSSPSSSTPPASSGSASVACTNDKTFRYKEKANKDCDWVSRKTKKRCRKVDPNSGIKIRFICPATCRKICCTNDATFRYKDKANKDCAWVSRNKKRRCRKVDQNSGEKIKFICPATCRNICKQ
jgi:hypothetical protein